MSFTKCLSRKLAQTPSLSVSGLCSLNLTSCALPEKIPENHAWLYSTWRSSDDQKSHFQTKLLKLTEEEARNEKLGEGVIIYAVEGLGIIFGGFCVRGFCVGTLELPILQPEDAVHRRVSGLTMRKLIQPSNQKTIILPQKSVGDWDKVTLYAHMLR